MTKRSGEKSLNVVMMSTGSLKPYDNNPRKNDNAVERVAESIKAFGFNQPIVVDKHNVVVVGHTRLKAAILLGLNQVPVLIVDKLSDEQLKAYRIIDNRAADFSEWDTERLLTEIEDLSKSDFDAEFLGFELEDIDPQGISIDAWDFSEVNDRFVITITSTQDKQAEIVKRLKGIEGVTIEASYFK
jgi:hypothetical protein